MKIRGIFSCSDQYLATWNSRFIVNDCAFPARAVLLEWGGRPVFCEFAKSAPLLSSESEVSLMPFRFIVALHYTVVQVLAEIEGRSH